MARGRANNGSGTIITHTGRSKPFQVQITVDGKRKSGGYYETHEEAAAALRALTSSVDQGTYIEPQKMKLADWMKIWLQDYCGHVAHGTLILYQGYSKNHIIPGLGQIQLCKLTPHQVQHFINNLKYQGKKAEKDMSYKTRKNVHGCLSAALEKAVEIKYIRENPATGCSIPRNDDVETSEEINPFTSEELADFLKAAEGSVYQSIYTFAVNTGMRLSEILGLRWSRFDERRAKIKIDCQLAMIRSKGEKRSLVPTKNKKTRSFKVAASVVAMLRQQRKIQAETRLKAGQMWQTEIEDLIFTDEYGRTIPHASVEHEFAEICSKAEITGHRFHDLRHTFATLALQHGADVKTLSEALGHYSVAFTLDVYGHVSEEMSNNFASLMDNIIAAR